MTAPVYNPLAVPADLTSGPFSVLWRGTPQSSDQLNVMIRASRAIEARCTRRFVPFANLLQTQRAEGVDIAESGYAGPLPLLAALGRSRAQAFGNTNDLVRDVWLDEHAPLYPELWTYSNVTVTLARAWGDQQIIAGTTLEGPEADTGHFRLPIGTWCPTGTTIRVAYSGGYTVAYPDDLRQACIFQAAKQLILTAEPQARPGMDTADLEAEIVNLLAPYART